MCVWSQPIRTYHADCPQSATGEEAEAVEAAVCEAAAAARSKAKASLLAARGASAEEDEAKAGEGGGGGGDVAAALAALSSGEASSAQGSGPWSELGSGLHTTQGAEQAALSVAEAPSDTYRSDPQPQAAGSSKEDKERQRSERQLQRKAEEALDMAIYAMQAGAR